MPLAIFDLDDTLWSREDSLVRWALLAAQIGALGTNSVAVVLRADRGGVANREDFLDEVRAGLGIKVSSQQFSEWYEETYPRCVQPFPGVEDGLRQWRHRGWHLGVATNGYGFRQRAKLKASGLLELFDAVVSADECGVSKPAPGIFQGVAAEIGCPLEGWVLGDSAEEDMLGAHMAGLRGGWVSKTGDWDLRGQPPDLVAPTVLDLLRLIDPW